MSVMNSSPGQKRGINGENMLVEELSPAKAWKSQDQECVTQASTLSSSSPSTSQQSSGSGESGHSTPAAVVPLGTHQLKNPPTADSKTADIQIFIKKFAKSTEPDMVRPKPIINLTSTYNSFWNELYAFPTRYILGSDIKLFNSLMFSDEILIIIAQILRRGWEEEHFFPTKLAKPFLEACLFNREKQNHVTVEPQMLLQFVEPTDRGLLEHDKEKCITEEIVTILQKYCSTNQIVSVGTKKEDAYNEVLRNIMYTQQQRVKALWTPILVGMLEEEEFKFLMKEHFVQRIFEEVDYDDYIPPHRMWQTYFYKWDEKKIAYYSDLVRWTRELLRECPICKESPCSVKHFVSTCEDNFSLMHKERHDCVMKIIVREINRALNKKNQGSYFASGCNWETVVMYGNLCYVWPEALGPIESKKYPHIIVYSTKPTKKVLIIELSVGWEHWMVSNRHDKQIDYGCIVQNLTKNGFKVDYQVVLLGSRGVVDEHLYNLFKDYLGMKHSEISRAMEEVSKKIVTVSYNIYKEIAQQN